MADESTKSKSRDNNQETDKRSRDRQSSGQRSSRPTRSSRYVRNVSFRSHRKVCAFCVDKVKTIDWKEPDALRRFIGDDGSIRARRKTGTCAKHQRRLAIAVKRARHLALLPFTGEHVRLAGKS